jgi:hypothetical protein
MNLVCISWHLIPSQRRTSLIPPNSRFVCMCIPPVVAKQRLGRNVTTATNSHATIELFDASKESGRLFLPRTSCCYHFFPPSPSLSFTSLLIFPFLFHLLFFLLSFLHVFFLSFPSFPSPYLLFPLHYSSVPSHPIFLIPYSFPHSYFLPLFLFSLLHSLFLSSLLWHSQLWSLSTKRLHVDQQSNGWKIYCDM